MVSHREGGGGISKNTFFVSLAVALVLGFITGTRGQEVMAALGPIVGIKVPHGQIDLSSVEKTYQQLNANFDGKLDTKKLINGANSGLVSAAGDKFTTYFTAEEAKSFNDSLNGNVGAGIGAMISMRNDQPTIVKVLPDNPAQKAGLLAGDVVTAVNDTSTDKADSDKVAAAIRGEAGSTVKVTVLRDGSSRTFSLTRAQINAPSVQSEINDGLGVMTITRFDSHTGDLARKAAEKFKANDVKGVIVDVRDNGGGVVDGAQSVSSLWLEEGKVVVTERTKGKVVDTLKAQGNPILRGVPTVILVNGDTASASEIVAGALRDNRAATLIGQKTYGKGTMQQIIDLRGGTQLKVTIGHWYTPGGVNIDHDGLTPDTLVDMTKEDANAGSDPQLQAAIQALHR